VRVRFKKDVMMKVSSLTIKKKGWGLSYPSVTGGIWVAYPDAQEKRILCQFVGWV
jgi:hypothetical protein